MAAMSDRDRGRICKWARGLDGGVTLRYSAPGHSEDDRFQGFVDQMAVLAPIRVKKDDEPAVSLPTLFIGRGLAYQALPGDRELEPFLAVLADPRAFADRIAPEVNRRLAGLRTQAGVKLYITVACPFCPAIVMTLLGLAACSERVRLTVIDGELFPEAARNDRIKSVPTVILDDGFRWTGTLDVGELVDVMLDRDPADLGTDALRGMIEEGDAKTLARMMADRRMLFPAFFDLLRHPRWSVRLGAMVTFENLFELDPELAAGVAEPIVSFFDDVDDTVKGDLLHVLGESGNPAVLPFVKTVAGRHHEDEVRQAADEAIEKIETYNDDKPVKKPISRSVEK